MRKNVGFVVLALGAALLAVGVVCTTWAPGVVKKTPLDVETTTNIEGQASTLGEPPRPIRITSLTRTDSEASDSENAVFVQTQCAVFTDAGEVPDCPEGEDERILTIGDPDRFVTDRETGLAVDEEGYIDDEFRTVQHDGLVNKFPFDTEKKEYPYWDGLTSRSWPAEFVDEEDVKGLETYHFRIQIDSDSAEVVDGETGSYTNTIDLWVEPRTGAIIQQTQDQTRSLDGNELLSLEAAFTDDQVQTFVDDANDNIGLLDLVTRTLPLIGYIGGVILLLAGAAIVFTGRRRETGAEPSRSDSDSLQPAGV